MSSEHSQSPQNYLISRIRSGGFNASAKSPSINYIRLPPSIHYNGDLDTPERSLFFKKVASPLASKLASPELSRSLSTVKQEEEASFEPRIEPENNLADHMSQYKKNVEYARKDRNNIHQISEIIDFFAQNKSKITKFNHCVESATKVTQSDGFIQLTVDDELKIILKKPNKSHNRYILEADPKVIEMEQNRY